ncbi:MAG: putative Integrator complex subunit 4 [Streblomastix strix]|uniref:Cilia- and flagella-associated protein 300 n=1 Tax=Streblomastix strix TaxID=222440 RepID=A0A5J4WC76_9EUKA|nr:MAG: putative Integrator complex subunit 4 [Streblomastix strix]
MTIQMERWNFRHIESPLKNTCSRENQELLMKWGLDTTTRLDKFAFDEPIHPFQFDALIKAFCNTQLGQNYLGIISRDKGEQLKVISEIKTKDIPCTFTDLSIFDRIQNGKIVRSSGEIIKCFTIDNPDFEINDRLHECLVCEDSESYVLFTSEERSEFLFHIFKRLVFGGEFCQFEDSIYPYIDMAKNIYKDLVAVQRNPTSGLLEIRSRVRQLTSGSNVIVEADGKNIAIYPGRDTSHPRNGLYFIIDCGLRTLNVAYFSK